MLQTKELLDSVTTVGPLGHEEVLARAVDVLGECEEAVTACAAGMIAAQDADELRTAIGQNLDCADVAVATRRVLTRGSTPDPALLTAQVEACLIACERSRDLCGRHAARHEHCRICAEVTGRAADVCRDVLAAARS
ncbi:hypothetical protein [Streptomyces sp. CRN 30]|uniref:hypothetical protein n=1 Tax=Streptomyces sp. CRN 30 TaxID=3075613 RepID=UPI002A836297|nr:hypothetical protein [Streptomyces sp. CRN 30]